MSFILSIAILILTTLLLTSILHPQRLTEFLLEWGLISFAAIIFVFQVANLFRGLNSVPLILFLQTIFLVISVILWIFFRKPKLFPMEFNLKQLLLGLTKPKNYPLFGLLLIATGYLLLSLVLIYIVPPNNNDALSFHVARVIHWMQQGSYFPWETPVIWQLTFPVNAQLTYLWILLFSNTDHFIAYIPFFAGVLTSLLVYSFSREMGFSRRGAAFVGLIWLTYPVVQLHLSSVRHDLISTWLFLSLLYFFHRWGKQKQNGDFILSGLALGLVVGTNFSIAAYLPGFALIVILGFWCYRYSFRDIFKWAGWVLLVFCLFSSQIYISNEIHFGSVLGAGAMEMTSASVIEEMQIQKYVALTSTRWVYQLVDFSWIPGPAQSWLINIKASIARVLTEPLGLNLEGDIATLNEHIFTWDRLYQLQEDEAWFGLIGFLMIFPISIIGFIQAIKEKDLIRSIPLILFLTSLITYSLIRPGWTPFDGRYFMTVVAMATALLPKWFEGKHPRIWLQWAFVFIALISTTMVTLFNPAKQIIGGAAVWNMNRIDKLTRQIYSSKEMLYLADGIPSGVVVGVVADFLDYQEYGLFGEDFSRKIVNVYPLTNSDNADWLHSHNIEYMLLLEKPGSPQNISDDFSLIDSLGDWMLFHRNH